MNTKTVYQTDSLGWYLFPTDAYECQIEHGKFHIPAGAYEEAPPARPWPEGLWPRHVGGAWIFQEKPVAPAQDPAAKLAAFLSANPDVAAMIEGASPGGV